MSYGHRELPSGILSQATYASSPVLRPGIQAATPDGHNADICDTGRYVLRPAQPRNRAARPSGIDWERFSLSDASLDYDPAGGITHLGLTGIAS